MEQNRWFENEISMQSSGAFCLLGPSVFDEDMKLSGNVINSAPVGDNVNASYLGEKVI